jgi:hypothetical protein
LHWGTNEAGANEFRLLAPHAMRALKYPCSTRPVAAVGLIIVINPANNGGISVA